MVSTARVGHVVPQCDLKPGSVVRLKSGGPLMTVAVVQYADLLDYGIVIDCIWIGRDDQKHRERFPLECLIEQSVIGETGDD